MASQKRAEELVKNKGVTGSGRIDEKRGKSVGLIPEMQKNSPASH